MNMDSEELQKKVALVKNLVKEIVDIYNDGQFIVRNSQEVFVNLMNFFSGLYLLFKKSICEVKSQLRTLSINFILLSEKKEGALDMEKEVLEKVDSFFKKIAAAVCSVSFHEIVTFVVRIIETLQTVKETVQRYKEYIYQVFMFMKNLYASYKAYRILKASIVIVGAVSVVSLIGIGSVYVGAVVTGSLELAGISEGSAALIGLISGIGSGASMSSYFYKLLNEY